MKNVHLLREAATGLSSSAVHVLAYVISMVEAGGDTRLPDVKLAQALNKHRETVSKARQEIVEAGLARVETDHAWVLSSVSKNSTNHDHHDHHQGSSEDHGPKNPSERSPESPVKPPGEADREDIEALVARCIQEVGLFPQVAEWLCRKHPNWVKISLKWFPAWKAFRDDVVNWAGWFYTCVTNGGLRKPTEEAIAYHELIKSQKGAAPQRVPASVPVPRSATAPEEPTRQQQERAAEQAQREAEEAIVRQQFEVIWPTLSEEQKVLAQRAARKQIPAFLAGKLDEQDEMFQALLRAQTVELFGKGSGGASQEQKASGLPMKTSTRLKGLRNVMTSVGEALSFPGDRLATGW